MLKRNNVILLLAIISARCGPAYGALGSSGASIKTTAGLCSSIGCSLFTTASACKQAGGGLGIPNLALRPSDWNSKSRPPGCFLYRDYKVEFNHDLSSTQLHADMKQICSCPDTHGILANSWVKTKGACHYSDGSSNAIASTQVTTHDECKHFCNANPKCDAFETDGSDCFLFRHRDGKTHTGNGEGPHYCYSGAATSMAAAPKNDKHHIAESNSAENGIFTWIFISSLYAPIIVIVSIVVIVAVAAATVIVVLVKKHNGNDPNASLEKVARSEKSLGNDALPALPMDKDALHALPLDETNTNIGIMVKEASAVNDYADGLAFV